MGTTLKDYGKAICPYCQGEFVKHTHNQVYCNPSHAQSAAIRKWQINNQGKTNDYAKVYAKVYREKIRDQVFELLGNKCIGRERYGFPCSDESDPIVLTIDHIQAVGKSRDKLTVQIYMEILKNPEEGKKKYQLLCRNCNWRKLFLNNERQLTTLEFAYRWELDALQSSIIARLEKVESIFNGTYKEKQRNSQTTIMSELEIAKMLEPKKAAITNSKGKLDTHMIRIFCAKEHHIEIGYNKSYTIKAILEQDENGQI